MENYLYPVGLIAEERRLMHVLGGEVIAITVKCKCKRIAFPLGL